MCDRRQSIRHPRRTSWEDQPAFREHFLSFVPPGHRDAFRRLGDLFFTVLLESPYVEHDHGEELRGLAADVGAAVSILDQLVRDVGEDELFPKLLTGWSARLDAIREEIGEALDGGEHAG